LVKKKEKGGIAISNTVPLTHIDHDEIKAVLAEYRIANADVAFRCDATVDELIDVVGKSGDRSCLAKRMPANDGTAEGNRVYIPCIYVLNKIDAISIEELDLLYRIPNSIPISAKQWLNIDELIDASLGRFYKQTFLTRVCVAVQFMWDRLSLVRIYTKPRGSPPDYSSPVVLRKGRCTVEDFAMSIHKEILKQMKYAIVWGSVSAVVVIAVRRVRLRPEVIRTSAKHARGQKVGQEHVLEDEDVVCSE
jgi:ribosome-interacting GTPase 1